MHTNPGANTKYMRYQPTGEIKHDTKKVLNKSKRSQEKTKQEDKTKGKQITR